MTEPNHDTQGAAELAAPSGDVDEIAQRYADRINAQREGKPVSQDELLDGMRDGEWLDAQQFPELTWCVPGIVSEGFGLLVGPPKVGKSWMVGGIALACATGGLAFERIAVPKRPVLYMALEDGHRRLQSRFRVLMSDQPLPAGISFIVKAEQNIIVATIAAFMLRNYNAAPLVILDTLGKARPPKSRGEDPYAADYAFGTKLKNVVDSVRGASLLVVHHTRKAESLDFVDAVSGTQGVAGSADFVLVLARKRKSDNAVLSVTGRDIPENEYALVTEGGRWSLDGTDLADAAAAVERRQKEQRKDNLGDRAMDVLAFVNERTEDTTALAVAEKFGMSNDDAGKCLRRLLDKNLIQKRGRGAYKPLSERSEASDGQDKPSSAQLSLSDTPTGVSDTPTTLHRKVSETNPCAEQRKQARSDVSDRSDSVVTQFDPAARARDKAAEVTPEVIEQARVKVLELLAEFGEQTGNDMRQGRMTGRIRLGVVPALAQLVQSGDVLMRIEGTGGHKKKLYRLAGTPPQEGSAS